MTLDLGTILALTGIVLAIAGAVELARLLSFPLHSATNRQDRQPDHGD